MTARRTSKAAAQPEQTEPEPKQTQPSGPKKDEAPARQMHELARELIIDAYNLRAVDPKVMRVLVDDEDGRKAVVGQLAWMRSIQVDHVGVAHRAGVPELLDELPPVDPAPAHGEDKQGD